MNAEISQRTLKTQGRKQQILGMSCSTETKALYVQHSTHISPPFPNHRITLCANKIKTNASCVEIADHLASGFLLFHSQCFRRVTREHKAYLHWYNWSKWKQSQHRKWPKRQACGFLSTPSILGAPSSWSNVSFCFLSGKFEKFLKFVFPTWTHVRNRNLDSEFQPDDSEEQQFHCLANPTKEHFQHWTHEKHFWTVWRGGCDSSGHLFTRYNAQLLNSFPLFATFPRNRNRLFNHCWRLLLGVQPRSGWNYLFGIIPHHHHHRTQSYTCFTFPKEGGGIQNALHPAITCPPLPRQNQNHTFLEEQIRRSPSIKLKKAHSTFLFPFLFLFARE